jgi:hypothetical protein
MGGHPPGRTRACHYGKTRLSVTAEDELRIEELEARIARAESTFAQGLADARRALDQANAEIARLEALLPSPSETIVAGAPVSPLRSDGDSNEKK